MLLCSAKRRRSHSAEIYFGTLDEGNDGMADTRNSKNVSYINCKQYLRITILDAFKSILLCPLILSDLHETSQPPVLMNASNTTYIQCTQEDNADMSS